MAADDFGYTVVAPSSGIGLVCHAGQCFALRSAAPAAGGVTTGITAAAVMSALSPRGDDEDWDFPRPVIGLRRTDGHEIVGALAHDVVAQHLGGLTLERGTAEALVDFDSQGQGALDVGGLLTLDDTASALAATPMGTPERLQVMVHRVLHLETFDSVIASCRETGTRVEFIFVTGT
jgi:hypothetical protein